MLTYFRITQINKVGLGKPQKKYFLYGIAIKGGGAPSSLMAVGNISLRKIPKNIFS